MRLAKDKQMSESTKKELVIDGQQTLVYLGRLLETKIDSVLQNYISEETKTTIGTGLIIESDTMKASIKEPNVLSLSFTLLNIGHEKASNAFENAPNQIVIQKEIDITNAHQFMAFVSAPLSSEQCKKWMMGDAGDEKTAEGIFWATNSRYNRDDKDFTEEDFAQYCEVNKTNALCVQLTALRVNKEALLKIAVESFQKVIEEIPASK